MSPDPYRAAAGPGPPATLVILSAGGSSAPSSALEMRVPQELGVVLGVQDRSRRILCLLSAVCVAGVEADVERSDRTNAVRLSDRECGGHNALRFGRSMLDASI